MDVVSDALRVIRLKGALFLNAEFREPWCVLAPDAGLFAPMLPGARPPLAICHLVVQGRCWAQLEGEAPVEVEEGDALVLPRGDAHRLGSGRGHAPLAARDGVALELPVVARRRYGGDGAATVALCGWFGYDSHVPSPVLGALPRLFRAGLRRRPSSAWLERSIQYAADEAASGRAGADALAAKLAEVLFVEALRGYMEALPPHATGWLAGLRDPLVGRSLELLHARPAEPWTVASLAHAVSASRSVLAERFTDLTGLPPMQYLMQWRIALAAHLLRAEHLSLVEVAAQVGYESEAAFNRAFKRAYGQPPGTWRRAHEAAGAAP